MYVAKIVVVALLYVATAKAGLALAYENSSVTAVWAPTGIALAALLLGGPRLWPGIALGALFANAWTGIAPVALLGITAGNTLEALAGLYLLRAAGFRPSMRRVRDVLALVVLGAGVSTLVAASVGVLSLHLGGNLPDSAAASAWRTWWLGDMGGDLLAAPVVLLIAAAGRPKLSALRARRVAEVVVLAGLTATIALLVFSSTAPLAYLVLPLPIWAALRFGQVGAAVVSLIVAGIAIAATVSGFGPFAESSSDAGLLLSQTFVGVGAAIGLLLAAVTAERSTAQAETLAAHVALEAKVGERTAALASTQERLVEAHRLLQIGSWEWDVSTGVVTWSDELYRIYGVTPGEYEPTFAGYLERVHAEDRDRVAAEIGTALQERDTFSFDERIERTDGVVRILASRGQVHRDDDGRPLRMLGICQDVTETRRAERALRESEERARLIVDGASDAFISSDEHDVITDWNVQAQALFGWTRAEAVGRRLGDLVMAPPDRERHRATIADYLATGDAPWRNRRLQRQAVHRDGHVFAVELTISPAPTEDGTIFNTFLHDVSERLRHESYLATEHAVARVLLESRSLDEARPLVLDAFGTGLGWAAGGWWGVDGAGGTARCECFWSAASTAGAEHFEQATMAARFTAGVGLPGRVWQSGEPHVVADIAGDDNFPRHASAAQAGLIGAIAVPLRARGETVAVIEFYATEHLHLGGELGDMMARLGERVAQFVERMAAENDLREAEERFHRAFEDAGTGMALIGIRGEQEGRLLEVNDALCTILRYPIGELLGMRIADLTHPEDVAATRERVRRLVDGEIDAVHSEGRLIDADGGVVWIAFSTSLIRDGDGEPLYRISQLQDMTERKRFETQLQHLADHDPITGLFNRRRFDEELARELAVAQRFRTGGAVLALDLDNFKYVNDTLGHGAGDELIASVAEILRGRLRATDTVARLGGDEFAVILAHVDERQARHVAADLLDGIRSEAVVSTAKGSRRTTASIGIALFPDVPGELASEELLVEADIAMYDAKESGRDRACVFDADSSRQLSLQARMTWADEIREALAEDRFTLDAQPIVPLQPGGSLRHELLVRMIGRDGDIIPPGAFLPVAERFDLVQEIDRWVISRAIALLGERQRRGEDVCFEVNLSAKSLAQADLPAQIARQIAAQGADPSRLIFEVTETAAIVNVERAKLFARRLGELGCGFALDDFGAGFASFYYLKHLPFDYLKIDGEFVESLTQSTTNQLVVQSLVTIARGLGKQTIAEYVGDAETVELLRSYGVDYAQGFYIGRPRPVAELTLLPAVEGVSGG
jgi:diguanylate cyclase (GGDEF)-like protein/PAS domain S-box-containing protein